MNAKHWRLEILSGEHIFNFLMHKNTCPTFLLETLIQISHNICLHRSYNKHSTPIPSKYYHIFVISFIYSFLNLFVNTLIFQMYYVSQFVKDRSSLGAPIV